MAKLLEVEHILQHKSKPPANPAEGDLLVWHSFERTGQGQTHHLYGVVNPIEAIHEIDRLAKEQVDDHDIGWNGFGLNVYEDGEWVEWENEDGLDIYDYQVEVER